MTILEQLDNDIRAYPETNVQLEIVEVEFPDSALNEGEVGTFRVRVTNTGLLNLTDVSLRIKGVNGATVADNGLASPFVEEFVTQEIPKVAADGGSELTISTPLRFKAPNLRFNEQPGVQTLVEATLKAWDADLNRSFNDHTRPLDTVSATFAAQVHPQ